MKFRTHARMLIPHQTVRFGILRVELTQNGLNGEKNEGYLVVRNDLVTVRLLIDEMGQPKGTVHKA